MLLKKYSSYKIGGRCNYLFFPENTYNLKSLLEFAKSRKLTPLVFGYGTNILFPDKPSKEYCFISLRNLRDVALNENKLYLGSGVPISILAVIGILSASSRFYFSHLLPGSTGGAIYMNARCYGGEISEIVKRIFYLDENLSLREIEKEKCSFDYKDSIFQKKNWVILGAEFEIENKLEKENFDKIMKFLKKIKYKNLSDLKDFYNMFNLKKISKFFGVKDLPDKIVEIENDRVSKHHFDFPSCGSYFKNNYSAGKPTGKIIDELGLKGYRVGGAKVSDFHANFILNYKNATKNEVVTLMEFLQKKVYEKEGFIPEPEVKIVDEKPASPKA